MKIGFLVRVLTLQAVSIPLVAAAQGGFVDTLLPKPTRATFGEGSLVFSGSFSTGVGGFRDARLNGAIERLLTGLEDGTGTLITKQLSGGPGATLVVDVRGGGEIVQSVDEDESYSLTVSSSGARLQAATEVGAMRGMQTFLQLLQSSPSGYSFPAVQIEDAPRFR